MTVELEARKVPLRRDLEEVREGVLGVLDARFQQSVGGGHGGWTERMRGECGRVKTREVRRTNQVEPRHLKNCGLYSERDGEGWQHSRDLLCHRDCPGSCAEGGCRREGRRLGAGDSSR